MSSVKVTGQKPGAHAFDGVKAKAVAHHKQGAEFHAPRATMTTAGGGYVAGIPGSSVTPEELTRLQLLQDAGEFANAAHMQMQAPVSEIVDIMEKAHTDGMALQDMQYHVAQLNSDPMWNKWYIDNHPETFEKLKETIKNIGDLLVKLRIADLMGVPDKETLELNRLIAEGYITSELFYNLGVMPLDDDLLRQIADGAANMDTYAPGMFAPRSFYQGPPRASFLAGPQQLSGVYGGRGMLQNIANGRTKYSLQGLAGDADVKEGELGIGVRHRFRQATATAPRDVFGGLFGGAQDRSNRQAARGGGRYFSLGGRYVGTPDPYVGGGHGGGGYRA